MVSKSTADALSAVDYKVEALERSVRDKLETSSSFGTEAQQKRLLAQWFGQAKIVTEGGFKRALARVHFAESESQFLWDYYRKGSHLKDKNAVHLSQILAEIFDVRA